MQIVAELLQGFERDGYRKAILVSGHYPNRTQYLDDAIQRYQDAGGTMDVLALVENQAPGVGGDHAAKFETSFMLYLHPMTVDLERLNASQDDPGGPDERRNWMIDEYKGHPCYGLAGIDPRQHASAEIGRANTELLLEFFEGWLAEK